MEVMLFAGCVIDQYFPETAFNAVKILERVGCTVRVPGNSGCCGWPAWQNAQEEISRDIAGRCLAELSPERPVVTLSSDCSAMMHSYIPQLLHNGSAHHSAVSLHKRVHTFSQWVVLQAGGPLCPPRIGMTRLACHVSCCVQNDDIPQALPRLMGELGGFSCIEVPGFSVCCGYGGGLFRSHPEVSARLAADKLRAAREAGADCIVTEDMGCLMQMRAVAAGQPELDWQPDRIVHAADLLAEGW